MQDIEKLLRDCRTAFEGLFGLNPPTLLMERIDAALAEPHELEIGEKGWQLGHPVTCRPNILDCPVHVVVAEEYNDGPAGLSGRYAVYLSGAGYLVSSRLEGPGLESQES